MEKQSLEAHHEGCAWEEGELEEGEVADNATKSPSPRTTAPAPSAGGNQSSHAARRGGAQEEPAEMHGSSVHAVGRSPRARPQVYDATTAAGRIDAPRARAPPTEPRALRGAIPTGPRALRQFSAGPATNVARTPPAPRSPVPPTDAGPADPTRHGSFAGLRRPASPPHNAPAAKRRRPSPVVITTAPDEQGNKILRLETLVREKEKHIDDLQWALAEAQALFHIYKTRGPDHWDVNLNEHIKTKYWKRNNPDRAKDNWRFDELSDISDEEDPAPRARRLSQPSREDPAPSSIIHGDLDSSPGEIFTYYHELDESVDAPCAFDEEVEHHGDAAAHVDLAAAANALRRKMRIEQDVQKPQAPTSAAQELSREQLFESTAVAQYGLRFSYTLSLWQENGRWLPAPLGRFGQPYWKGSAWEDFDPRRIFMKEGVNRVALDSKKFLQLAQDAARIAFVYRSATQRQVVSLALQHNLGLVNPHEPDMVSLCRTNPSRVPLGIRRHYRCNATKEIFYTEYDAADISNHILLSLSGPQKTQQGITRKNFQDQKRAWLELMDTFILEWLPLFSKRLADPLKIIEDVLPWPLDMDLVKRRVPDDVLFTAMWVHLTGNGVPRRCLLPGGDFHDYIRRSRIMEKKRKVLSTRFDTLFASEKLNQEVKRAWVGDQLPFEPVPEGFPVLRVKMSVKRQTELAMKYREHRNEKKFIPL